MDKNISFNLGNFADFLDLSGFGNSRIDKSLPTWAVHAALIRNEIICPHCGSRELTKKGHSKPKYYWDAPVRGNKIRIVVTRQQYICSNPRCKKMHSDPIPWIDVSQGGAFGRSFLA